MLNEVRCFYKLVPVFPYFSHSLGCNFLSFFSIFHHFSDYQVSQVFLPKDMISFSIRHIQKIHLPISGSICALS